MPLGELALEGDPAALLCREGQDARERTSKMRKLKYHEQKLLKKVRD